MSSSFKPACLWTLVIVVNGWVKPSHRWSEFRPDSTHLSVFPTDDSEISFRTNVTAVQFVWEHCYRSEFRPGWLVCEASYYSSRDAVSSESEACSGTAVRSWVVLASMSSSCCEKELIRYNRCVVQLPWGLRSSVILVLLWGVSWCPSLIPVNRLELSPVNRSVLDCSGKVAWGVFIDLPCPSGHKG